MSGGVAAIVAAVVLVAVPASSAPAPDATPAAEDVATATTLGRATIEVTSQLVSLTTLNLGPKTVSPGDVQISRSKLWDRNGRLIGQRHLVCTVIVGNHRDCRGTYLFPRGKLVVGGSLNSRVRYVLAVIGGTGLYENARGALSSAHIAGSTTRDRVFIQLVG